MRQSTKIALCGPMRSTRSVVFMFAVLAVPASLCAQSTAILSDFSQPFQFSYLAWQDAVTTAEGLAHIRAKGNGGGAGNIVKLDLSGFGGRSPQLTLRVNAGNLAQQLSLLLIDADGTSHQFHYLLQGQPAGSFVELTPTDGAGLGLPNKVGDKGKVPGLQLADIVQIQLQGDWQEKAIDVSIDRLELIEPDATILAARTAFVERQAQAEAHKAQAAADLARRRAETLAHPRHPEDGPNVADVCAVDGDLLCLTIQELRIEPAGQIPYQAEPGDEIRRTGELRVVVDSGTLALREQDLTVWRMIDGKLKEYAPYAPLGNMVRPPDNVTGETITDFTLDAPEAYRIHSQDDPNYAEPAPPNTVWRKSKLTDLAVGSSRMPVRHDVFLKLSHPLQNGKTYVIKLNGVNTRQAAVTYTHEPTTVRSEAVHVSQIGYRPSDPFKRAFLSIWLGTGGAHRYQQSGMTFSLIDEATGKSAYEGDVKLATPADRGEASFKEQRNYSQTDVLFMDFSDFTQPGRYRLCVAGIGCSYSFEVASDVWLKAFKVSMQGFLRQRSGIALGPPLTNDARPRNFHPADGSKFYQLTIPFGGEQEEGRAANLRELYQNGAGTLEPVEGVWGGYMDAGDWDTLSPHLEASYLNLDLLDLWPDVFATVELGLPPAEADNTIPDLLDEALWNLAAHKRLQLADGSVRGGFGPGGSQHAGETSWQSSDAIGVYAPDITSTYRYAAVAAKAARLLGGYNPQLAAQYQASAVKAWAWARTQPLPTLEHRTVGLAALAAVELYWLTESPAYHAAFTQLTTLSGPHPDSLPQIESIFGYARLPDGLADASFQKKARAAVVRAADDALAFADGNSFGITSAIATLPPMGFVSYFSVPEMAVQVLPRAHYLTGDKKYLRGAVRAANFSAGANPENMTYTVGVGERHPQHPLHLDTRVTGQAAPAGITVYGQSDPAENYAFNNWVYPYFLDKTLVPNPHTWPAAEAYVDLPIWPATTEFTVTQSLGPTSYYWGYLAARPDQPR